ncbi:beta-ketoacyl synthase chain length factor [Methylomonas sp. SURF-2]|uniref:Beta-ketoacyl synthase chain length factor n=1 Tax=Methylomonas subterranea TaxID=2952225 RepID=A0ABT1TFF7_9GAMM|nr:beta-ketoacyl synthase chain length factor [Methylomonas sp. SURF-2]MCQ8104211.1 beta-ketoacyl synthase chain length factor [Methylomonas sp. SURF-2]
MDCMSLLGFGACAPDAGFRAGLPFPADDITREAMPAMLRRRASRSTQMAFSAALRACSQAGRSPAGLPAVFASAAGEIQITDQLCLELTRAEPMVSPAAFHNSVQNTVAGYWSIAQRCTQPATALAAGDDTFAMGLLEAWCQLACLGGELLLVCYDERWPAYLAPGRGQVEFASALLLAAGGWPDAVMQLGRPVYATSAVDEFSPPAGSDPVLAVLPLLARAAGGASVQPSLPVGRNWLVDVHKR